MPNDPALKEIFNFVKNSKHNRTEPSWGGGAVEPGFYDILNGNRAASNILRSDKIFGTRTYLLIFSILRVCDCNIVV